MKIINAINKNNFVINNKVYYIQKVNRQVNESVVNPLSTVNHWTAGDYDDMFDDYHFNIAVINNEIVVVKTLSFKQKGQHLIGRNSGMIGITMCAMKDWKLFPTKEQIDTMAVLNAEICCWKNLNPKGKITLPKMKYNYTTQRMSYIGGNQTFNVVSDHREYAIADGYGRDRQDINNTKINVDYMIEVRAKTIQYFNELKAGKRKFIFESLLKE